MNKNKCDYSIYINQKDKNVTFRIRSEELLPQEWYSLNLTQVSGGSPKCLTESSGKRDTTLSESKEESIATNSTI
jgi:hypothetical protein